MTIIVGVIRGSTVTIGGDSRYTSNSYIHPCTEAKIWRQGPLIIGLTGSTREAQIIRHATTIPEPVEPSELKPWLSTTVVDKIREARKASGFDEKKGDGTEVGPRAMVGILGRLFVVFEDYCVLEYPDSMAIGSGMDFAIGSLATTANMRMSATRRVKVALGVACIHDAYCAPPFTVLRGRGPVKTEGI